jgi:hypothetical protein
MGVTRGIAQAKLCKQSRDILKDEIAVAWPGGEAESFMS